MLRELFPRWATSEQWSAYHLVRRARHQDLEPDDPLKPDGEAERDLRMPGLYQDEHHYLEVRDGRPVGMLTTTSVRFTSPEFESNRHLLEVDGWVTPALRRQGIARSWLLHLLRRADACGATVLTTWAMQEAGHSFLRGVGASARLTWRESRLEVGSVDWEMVRGWVEEGERRSPGARLEAYPHRIPAARLEEVAAAKTALENLVPTEDLDHGRDVVTADELRRWYAKLDLRGSSHDTCLVRAGDGAIVGLTDTVADPWEPSVLRQDLTAVDPGARGRGIGKWLKAAMLELARERHPEARRMVTENARSNDPMLAINTRLGFRLYRVATDYQITRETLAATVATVGADPGGAPVS